MKNKKTKSKKAGIFAKVKHHCSNISKAIEDSVNSKKRNCI